MVHSRREFIKTTGRLTIGFCLGSRVLASFGHPPHAPRFPGDPADPQTLPGDLADNPRINAWLEVLADGRIRVLTGKIELGQGIGTAVAQVAAEELEMDMSQVEVLLAETGRTPDEGYTAGSNSIESSAIAIRFAAAAARQHLLDLAAKKLNTSSPDLTLSHGKITSKSGAVLTFADVLDGRQITDEVHLPVTLKPKDKYRLVGKAIPRDDTRRIALGQPIYVHDLDFPGMVHARIIRPPSYGASLLRMDLDSVGKKTPGLLKLVVNGSFLAVVCSDEYQAIRAQRLVREQATWSDGPALPKLEAGGLPDYLKTLPIRPEKVGEKGDIGALLSGPNNAIMAEYAKPYIMHGSIGPSCAVALFDNGKLDVWTHSQGVYPLREALAGLLHLPAADIHVKGMPGPGCYGHNGADDVAADAALVALAYPGKHVRLQWSRDDEHGWEPYGSAMVMQLGALLDDSGRITHWNYTLWSDSHGNRPGGNAANLLAARDLQTPITGHPSGFSGGAYRNAEPYYNIPNQRVTANFFTGPLRVSSLRSLGAYANLFAIESFMDELAKKAGKDPFEFRLLHLDDDRAREVLLRLQSLIAHVPTPPNTGLGIAFSRYKNSGAYCAVAALVSVNAQTRATESQGKQTHTIRVRRMWAVVDAGEIINLDGIKNQIEGGMAQSASWTLMEQVKFDEKHVTSRDWATYPVMHINQAPQVEVTVIDRPASPAFGGGEAAQGPAAAAIANAYYHVTGKRIRQLPLA